MSAVKVEYDIVIIGGGLVGAAMALTLSGVAERFQLQIAILDKAPSPIAHSMSPHIGLTAPATASILDQRATALALGSRNLLDSIGIWYALTPYTQAIERIDVSDRGHKFGTQMLASDMDKDALGYVLQNQHLLQVFWQHLQQHCSDNVHFIGGAAVTHVDNAYTNSQVQFEQIQNTTKEASGKATKAYTLTTQLIIMADGGKSSLRQQMGIHQFQQNYEQMALVVNAQMSRPHGGLACERFTSQGPMAGLPLLPETYGEAVASITTENAGYMAMVWTQSIERQEEIEAMDDKQLMAELQQQMGYRLGEFQVLGTRQIYSLALTYAQEQVRQGLAIIGNAAHTLHPIAGQGFNLALRGVFSLAEQITRACHEGKAIGDLHYLQRFVEQSSQDQKRTVVASDQVMKLFASQQKSLLIGRQLGLFAMERVPLMKKIFTRAAMGLDRPIAKVLPIPHAHFEQALGFNQTQLNQAYTSCNQEAFVQGKSSQPEA